MTPADASPNHSAFDLATPAIQLPGVDEARANALARLGIHNVGDLIKHLPYRWEFHAGQTAIGDLLPDQIATVQAEIAKCRWVPPQRKFRGKAQGRYSATLVDDTGELDVVWFNARYLKDRLTAGMEIIVTAKVVRYQDRLQMVNPKWMSAENAPATGAPGDDERYHAIYPATADLDTDRIEKLIGDVLPGALKQIEDHLDHEYLAERAMPDLAQSYRMMHAPTDPDEPPAARRRLAYDELLLLQTGLMMKRYDSQNRLQAPALHWSEAIDRHIRDRFPFALTPAQAQVVEHIATDLQRTIPMNRLLQGDVGSGKTVVALYAMLLAVADNKQAAMMAPTELLAEQHFESISDMLAGSNVRLGLLTGSLTPEERGSLRARVEAGEIDIVIGTQALLTESFGFSNLAVVVIDEQHRFGVVQRATIRSKSSDGSTVPHTLVMTATPIPRTLSLTLFGDLDVSTITGMPPGRQPIDTRVVSPQKQKDVYEYIAGRVRGGEQLYVVVPAVEEGQAGLTAVRSHAEELRRTWFEGCRVASVHGRLKRNTRESIMWRFRKGEIQVLVATTVIEVGVDVPNASLMIVEHAERFGLAQLHQLRGRVGRGTKRSLCVFIADPTTDDATERVKAIGSTTDGFRIAEVDLAIRGMGELIGTRQSGLPPLRVANIPDDMDLLQMARRDAQAIIEADPLLTQPQHQLLQARLMKQYRDALGLGDVA